MAMSRPQEGIYRTGGAGTAGVQFGWTGCPVVLAAMRIIPLLVLILMVLDPDQVLARRKKGGKDGKDEKDKNKGPCGKAYLRELNGKCYYISTKKINWFGAQNNCLRKELNLADLSTPDDFKAVVQYLRGFLGVDDYWFGGNDLQIEGRFTYISSGRLVRYYGDLGLVEPTYRSNLDDCLQVRIRDNRTVVLDDNCGEKKYFVCEKSDQKCVYPSADAEEGDGQHHSHEHLHHFHHDAGKGEKQKEHGTQHENVESDSRPLDNSNSTEIGESQENEPGAATEVPGEGEATEPDGEAAGSAATNSTATDDAGSTTSSGATGATGAAGAAGAAPDVTGPAAQAPPVTAASAPTEPTSPPP
ncbi:uncharacterized protein Dana_GF13388 [Drosophila ananassae]|uniref:C-type lectin domain-containing protein n=2 Tax=Drosophila ananassae TaxID=7217 RepID=B3MCR7_DROAN|nr:uncharacterized protein Dana_GF13388 [Drosophila ananassae]